MPGRKILILTVVLSLFFGAASSVATVYALRRAGIIPPEVVYLDLRKLLQTKQREFTERVKSLGGKNDTQALKGVSADIDSYIKKLQAELDRQGGKRLILVRDAVIGGNVTDITPEIEARIR